MNDETTKSEQPASKREGGSGSSCNDLLSAFRCDRCDAVRETPFCPVCGERLTPNKYIGHNAQQLEHEYEEASRECRMASDRIRELERKHESEMKPAKEHHAKCAAVCREISEARDWARRNDIQHPDYRR